MGDSANRELLRLHLEAGWGISVPPIEGASVDLEPDGPLPPWSLYLAHMPGDEVAIWRPDVLSNHRLALLRRGHEADPLFHPAIGMRREVVLRAPAIPPAAPSHATRPLSHTDAALIEAFEDGSASYFLDPRRGPCIGVIMNGCLASIAHCSRRTAAACELGINTAPDARRQGYARAATLAWTQAIIEEGLTPIYSARASNTASLRLAVSCGYAPVIAGAYGPFSREAD